MSKQHDDQGQGGLFDSLFEGEPERLDPIWGDRWIREDRNAANVKPYGRREPEPETFDPQAASELTEAAIERADQAANPNWKSAFMRTLIDVAVSETEFTTDAVWRRLQNDPHVPKTHERRAAGALVKRAVRANVISYSAATKPSERSHCHGSILRVYESKIHGKDPAQFYSLATAGA